MSQPTDRSRLEPIANSCDWRALLVYSDLLEEEGDLYEAERARLRAAMVQMLEEIIQSFGVPAHLLEGRP